MEKLITLHQTHLNLGAKMVPFAGYMMPVQYEGVNIEHQTVREGVGVFDVSHMGEFLLKGDRALDLIQKISSNDATQLYDGKAQYACMPNGKGGIVDDLIIYRIKIDEYLLVVNAANIQKDWDWINSHNTFGVNIKNLSEDYSLLAIQGPKAIEAMQSLTKVNLSNIKYYHFGTGTFAGLSDIIISATGYTGSGGFEIYCKNEQVETLWQSVFEAGAKHNIKPIGLAARDTLRLEMGYCLYGNDIDDTTSPIEAGLGWITKFTKNFIDADLLKHQKDNGVNKKLVAFEMVDKGIPRLGYEIVNQNGQMIGRVTSGTMGPSVHKAIGLGYVNTPYSVVGSEIYIRIRQKDIKAQVVKLPFYKV